jgi:integrase
MGRAGQGVDVRETSIRITFTLDGTRRRETLMLNGEPLAPTPANVKYATRLAAEIRDRIKHGSFSMAEYFPASGTGAAPLTLAAQLTTWLAGQRITDSTRNAYRSAANFWSKVILPDETAPLGDKPLRALKTSQFLLALAAKPKLSGKTVNNYVSVLREALALAVIDKLLTDNPAENVPRAAWQPPEVDPFTLAEVEVILADLGTHYDAQVRNFVEAKFFMGLRTGEAIGLRWPSVDLRSKHVMIVEGVVQGQQVDRTKTNTVRKVLLNSRALAALTGQKAHTYVADGHVFHDPRYAARWVGERAFGRFVWKPCLKRCKIRYREPYQTRHTYATMMLMSGMRPAFCAGQMGHSVEIFHKHYAKWMPGAGDDAEMAKLEQTFKETGT